MITSYRELPLGKYMQIVKVCKEGGEDIDTQVALLSILTDKSEEELLNLPIMEYQALANKTGFLNKEMPEASGRIASSYKLGGYDLRPIKRVEDMTTAQYVDFQTFSKNAQERMVEIVSIFLIPKGCTYCNGYDVMDVQEVIRRELGVLAVNDLFAFFLSRYISSIRGMLTYSGWIVKRMKEGEKKTELMRKIQELKTILAESGDGFQALMQLPKPTDATGIK